MDLPAAQAAVRQYLLSTYPPDRDLLLVRGAGLRVWDSTGREYRDFLGGIAVNLLGHAHPELAAAIAAQAATLIHTSNLYLTEPMLDLAKRLSELCGGDGARCFFCNSGAEANEGALKLARKYGKTRPGDPFEVITAEGGFHGRTLATITATAQEKYQRPFTPLPAGFRYVPYNDLAALAGAVTERTVAVLLEPVQGEGGVRPADPAYLAGVRRLCDERGLLLIFDEVQTGVGRTGEWFAWQGYGVAPDLFTLAKGLGGGVPIGALVVLKPGLDFAPGDHASTFGGNPLAAAAALATLRIIEADHLLANARARGDQLHAGLTGLVKRFPALAKEARGAGLLRGLELTRPGAALVKRAQREGFLINCTAGNVLRFAPPLTVGADDVAALLTMLERILPLAEKE